MEKGGSSAKEGHLGEGHFGGVGWVVVPIARVACQKLAIIQRRWQWTGGLVDF